MNNAGFEIQRSSKGTNWTPIGFVDAKSTGASDRKLSYTFADSRPLPNVNLYRLKQIDHDGTFEYSPIESVIHDIQQAIKIYPNPFVDRLHLDGIQPNDVITVYDVTGKKIFQQVNREGAQPVLELGMLKPGMYILRVDPKEGISYSRKLLKK